MAESGQGKMFFTLGLIAVGVLFTIWSFGSQLYEDSFPSQGGDTDLVETAASDQSDQPDYSDYKAEGDPFVSVPPEGTRGGRPQELESDPRRGASGASVVIVEFGDFECAECATMAPILDQLLDEYPDDILHIWKDYPLPTKHPFSETAARAARCAQEQGSFWEYHDLLLERQFEFVTQPWSDLAVELELDEGRFSECLSSGKTEELVVQGFFIGRTLELEKAPSYFVNNQFISGAATYSELKQIIDQELADVEKE